MKPTIANKDLLVALRPVAPPDSGFLLRLFATTREAELARTGWPAARRDEFIRGQYQARSTDYIARYPSAEHSIITVNNQDAGVWMVWRTNTEFRLVNIELLPAHQGCGVGSTLIRRLLCEAKSLRLPVHLSVRVDNLAAARLYRHLGFSGGARDAGYLRMERKP